MDTLAGFDILLVANRSNDLDDGAERNMLLTEIMSWHNGFSSKDPKRIRNIALQIRHLLGRPNTSFEGLSLLSLIVKQSSFPVFAEHYQCWFQELRHFIKSDTERKICQISVMIFAEILRCGAGHPDCARWMAVNAPPCIPQLLDLSHQHDLSVTVGLHAIMEHLPGSCRSSLGKIHRRLLRMLLSSDERVVDSSAGLLARFPFMMAAGENGKSHAESWLKLYDSLCATLHASLEELYEGSELDHHDAKKLGQFLEFPIQSAVGSLDATAMFLSRYRQALAVCKCLASLLQARTSAALPVPIQTTISLLCRVFKITGVTIAANKIRDSRRLLLYSLLPSLHAAAFSVLESLIVSCGCELSGHSPTINSVILHTLQWTAAVRAKDEWKQSLGKLRRCVFRVLSTWISVSGGMLDMTVYGSGIVEQLLKDITIMELTVNLSQKETEDRVTTRKPPKAKRQKMDPNSADTLQQNTKETVDSLTCVEALRVLRVLLFSNADELPSKTREAIHDTATLTARTVQQSLPNVTPLYVDPACREALYDLVYSAVLNDPLLDMARLSTAISLLIAGKRDSCPKVKQKCIEALATCRIMIQPLRRNLRSSRVVEEAAAAETGDDEVEESYDREDCEPALSIDLQPFPPVVHHAESVLRKVKSDSPALVNGRAECGGDAEMIDLENVGEPDEVKIIVDDIVLVSDDDAPESAKEIATESECGALTYEPTTAALQSEEGPSEMEVADSEQSGGGDVPVRNGVEDLNSPAPPPQPGRAIGQSDCNGSRATGESEGDDVRFDQAETLASPVKLASSGQAVQSLDSMLGSFVAELPDEIDLLG